MRFATTLLCVVLATSAQVFATDPRLLSWSELTPIPDALGLAGAFAGVHNDALIVAGGANFPEPVWDNDKVWHDRVYVLTQNDGVYRWKDGGTLPRAIAYGTAVSTEDGVVCIGGNNSSDTFDDVFLLSWHAAREQITTTPLPSLPRPCAFAAATTIGDVIYLAGGQSGPSLDTAMTNFWSLDLSKRKIQAEFAWKELPAWPGPSRALNLTVSQHNGCTDCVYVISGRRQEGDPNEQSSFEFLRDVWKYNPGDGSWTQCANTPRCVMAGTSIAIGQSHVFVLGGATEELFFQGDELKDAHPGFIKQSLAYHTMTDTWTEAGKTPANHVTTIAVKWDGSIIIPSGEVRPRVRSPKIYRISPVRPVRDFGTVN